MNFLWGGGSWKAFVSWIVWHSSLPCQSCRKERNKFLWFLLRSTAWERVWTRHGLDSRADRNPLFYPGLSSWGAERDSSSFLLHGESNNENNRGGPGPRDLSQALAACQRNPDRLKCSHSGSSSLSPHGKLPAHFRHRKRCWSTAGVQGGLPERQLPISRKNPLQTTAWIHLRFPKPSELRPWFIQHKSHIPDLFNEKM